MIHKILYLNFWTIMKPLFNDRYDFRFKTETIMQPIGSQIVSYATVFCVVTQRSSSAVGRSLA